MPEPTVSNPSDGPAAAVTRDALHADLLKRIAARGGVKKFAASTLIIGEGDTADNLYIILSGRVKVYASNEEGREVIIALRGPGEYVGELALDGGERCASVMTTEPTTCSVVTGANLRQFIAEHPDFALHLIHRLIDRVREATGNVKSLALQDVYGRVVRLLELLAVSEGAELVVRERLTQQDISERVGSSREMVARVLKHLTQGQYLVVESGRITILRKLPSAW
jgi:CRP/FNR family cyclic AMP-dependent transcriptional regulator